MLDPSSCMLDPWSCSFQVASWMDSELYGKFIGISTFFNPGRHQNKVDNFRKFRSSVAAQAAAP